MTTVVVAVVPFASVRPAHLGKAAAARGLSPVFVAVRDALGESERAEYAALGPVFEVAEDGTGEAVAELRALDADGVLTFSEGLLPMTAALAAALELPYHDEATVTALTDKWVQRHTLADRGVDAVRSSLVTSREECLTVLAGRDEPVVVKPKRSQSSRDTFLVGPGEELPAAVRPTPEQPFVVEEYLRGRDEGEFGDYVSVESLVVGGEPVTLGVTGKFPLLPPFREQGQFVPARLAADDWAAVTRLASDAARALGVERGHVHTEIKLTPAGPKIIEVNGRLGGFMHEVYGRATGQDLVELGLAAACGLPVSPVEARQGGPVHVQYWNLPPRSGGELLAVEGVERLTAEEGVVGHLPRVVPGTVLEPAVTTHFMDIVSGRADDHAGLLTLLDRALPHLRFVYRLADGSTVSYRGSRHGLVPVDGA
ncbi:ATP-grasp domain-containing protein [Streptomyces albidoflavus]|uniref:ATP-grasp domain-containing protein n=1 Tax=Streptomyces albidoflavus TaxID=1886 RepID=UPI000FEFFFAE|nr:ATP-grasp domain-containing protein [Streptomyces albidoflavus]RWZ75961.1 ATP-grasp domain-containing protein [Streptomyces albidoflavus]